MDNVNLEKPKKMRLNVYLPDFLVETLDNYANKIGLNRSAALTTLIYPLYEKEQSKIYMDIMKELSNKTGSMTVDDMMKDLKSILDDMKDD